MLENALWFFLGALLHKILSTVLGISTSRVILQEVYDCLLLICDAVDVDLNNALNKRRSWLENTSTDEKEINRLCRDDALFKRQWKTLILAKFVVAIPKRYFRPLRYLTKTTPDARLRELKNSLEKTNLRKD